MSYSKMDPVLQGKKQQKIAALIAQILREEYEEVGGAVKRIARKIGANPRTVKNWYEGRRTPNLANFIELAETSSKFVELFLHLSGNDDFSTVLHTQNKIIGRKNAAIGFEIYGINFDTIKNQNKFSILQNLNQRQVRFYFQIRQGEKPTALDLTSFWEIGIATAKRDIAGLIDAGMIRFIGSKRYGYYSIL